MIEATVVRSITNAEVIYMAQNFALKLLDVK